MRRYGVMLPHFGEHATRESILGGARAAEALGFDSLWLRDHVVYRAHPWESQDLTFLDPIAVMSAVAAVTERITLGTGALIPHRHPIHLALLIGTLDRLAGPRRLIIGMGLGSSDKEFEAIGMGAVDRRDLWSEQMDVLAQLFTGRKVSHHGAQYRFDDIEIHPVPEPGSVELWYSGPSDAAVRRAVERCDGWGPVVMPRRDLVRKLKLADRLARERGRARPKVGVRADVSPGPSVEAGLRHVNLTPILANATRAHMTPPSGAFVAAGDLDGMVIAGPPETIVEEVRKYEQLGADEFVFDLRARSVDWKACLDAIGKTVLPQLRRSS